MSTNPQDSGSALESQFLLHISDIPQDVTKDEIFSYFEQYKPKIVVLKNHWNKDIPTQWAQLQLESEQQM